MPSSQCGSWPAFWLLSASAEWPEGGEIDILEGVNDDDTNAVTLHTSAGCTVDNSSLSNSGSSQTDAPQSSFSGHLATDNCDIAAPGQPKNVGCSIKAPAYTLPGPASDSASPANQNIPLASYGTPFNTQGGAIYAVEWTPFAISIWLFPRSSPFFAPSATTAPDPSTWPTPLAHFSGARCDFSQRFRDLKIIFDTTVCGEWAGKVWEKGGCRAKTGVETCEAFVRENPGVFGEAYWEVGGLKWYQKEGEREVGAGAWAGGVKVKGRKYRW